jgi:hypothetical protein
VVFAHFFPSKISIYYQEGCLAADGTARFWKHEKACINFSLDGRIFQAPRKKKLFRHCKKTANQLAKDRALVAKGIYCHEQWLRWKKSKEVMRFEETKLFGLIDKTALKALEARRELKALEARRAERARHE